MDKMMTAQEIAEIIGCCENTARDMMRKMPHFVAPGGKTRKAIRVWQTDFMQFLRANTVDPDARKGRKSSPRPLLRFTEGLDADGRIPRRKA
jgi:hypothetical protein